MFKYASVFCILFIYAKGDEIKCNGRHLYDDLGCQAGEKILDNCPEEYKCPDFKLNPNHCNFKARNYNLNEQVNDDLIYGACNVNCFCRNQTSTSATFTCAALDCPEWLGVPLSVGCYRKFELGKCCSTGDICPPFDESKNCQLDGQSYRLGERFRPKDSCKECVCSEGFKGELKEPFCRKQVCAVELRDSGSLSDNCAPVYYSKAYCCPDNWICPQADDAIKVITAKNEDSKLRCKYGEKMLKLGEGLQRTLEHWGKTRNVQCECLKPPFLTCHELDQ